MGAPTHTCSWTIARYGWMAGRDDAKITARFSVADVTAGDTKQTVEYRRDFPDTPEGRQQSMEWIAMMEASRWLEGQTPS